MFITYIVVIGDEGWFGAPPRMFSEPWIFDKFNGITRSAAAEGGVPFIDTRKALKAVVSIVQYSIV